MLTRTIRAAVAEDVGAGAPGARRGGALAWSLAAVALALCAGGAVLGALAGSEGDAWWIVVLVEATVVTPAAVGLVLTLRRPGNRVGGLLLANAILLGVLWIVEAYADYMLLADSGALPGGRWAALASDSDFPLLFAGPVAIALVFPNGRLPSPRWRRVPAAMIAIFAVTIVFASVSPEPFSAPYEDVSSPAPQLPAALWEPLALPVFLSLFACLVAAIAAVCVRYRRGTGIERLQVRWFAFAAALTPLTMAACLAFGLGEDSSGDAFLVGLFVVLMAVPVAVGVAVLRYRLYDIDRIINRTVVYGYSPRCWWARGRRPRSCSAWRWAAALRGRRRARRSGGDGLSPLAQLGPGPRRPALRPASLRRPAPGGGLPRRASPGARAARGRSRRSRGVTGRCWARGSLLAARERGARRRGWAHRRAARRSRPSGDPDHARRRSARRGRARRSARRAAHAP